MKKPPVRWPWDRPVLSRLHFDIVGGCQLRCVGCPNSTILPKVTRIKPEVFATCLANIDAKYVKLFRVFNYGEPLLHDNLPAIFDIIATVPKFKLRFLEMSTNAQFARWDQIEAVFRRKLLNRLVVSCDGDGTPASYEKFRPPGKWGQLIEFLERVRRLRDEHDPGMELMTRTVYFRPADMDRWRVVLEPRGFRPEFRRWLNLVGGAETHAEREWRPSEGVCSFVEGDDQLFVDVDGTVVPCCAHPRAGDFGNLRTQKWSEIVAGQKREEFIDLLNTKRASLDICGRCEYGPSPAKAPIGTRIAKLFGRKVSALEGP